MATPTGERIRAARLAKKWQQAQLAKRVGVDQGQLSRMERGLARIDVERLKRFAKALSIPARDLL